MDIIVHEPYRQLLGRSPDQNEFNVAHGGFGRRSECSIQDFFLAFVVAEFQLIY